MTSLKGLLGEHAIEWMSQPRGNSGKALVKLKDGSQLEISWRRDAHGIWIETPHSVVGFDIVADRSEDEGMSYRVSERVGARHWAGVRVQAPGEQATKDAASGKKKAIRIKAQMPGKITRILCKSGDEVQKDQALLVIEAMKMENEIRAPQAGRLGEIKVSEGQLVDTGAELVRLE